MQRLTVVMAGPKLPAVGGMASVMGALEDSSLAERVDLHMFGTGKVTAENRPLWQGIAARIQLQKKWWDAIGIFPRPIAHIHTCSGFTFFLDGILLLLAMFRGARTILHIHGARFDSFLDELSFPALILTRWLTRRADAVIVLSEDWRLRLSARLPGAKLSVVANGVPAIQGFSKREPVEVPRFLFLGGLCRRKGVHVIIEAVKKSKLPWCVDLAGGEDEPEYVNLIRQDIVRFGLSDRINLLGPVVGEEKNKLLRKSNGFVLPSLAEGLPMALLEAMAARLPVVVTSVGAMPEVVSEGIEGYVVQAEDSSALSAALDRLAESPQRRIALGEAAGKSFERSFGIEHMVHTLIQVYSKISREAV